MNKKGGSETRSAKQQPTLVRTPRPRMVTSGLIPAPPSDRHTAKQPPARLARPESVEEFQARGGKVQRIAGFERVKPHTARPCRWAA